MNVKKTKIYFDLGYFRIFHTAPNMPSVDIYVNDKLVAENLSYGNYTPYLAVLEEAYKISLYESGTRNIPILTNYVSIDENEKLTLAIAKILEDVRFLVIPDAQVPIDPSKSMIRFVHLSPNAPAVDITLPDGTILFSNISYKELTPYLSVDPSNYTLEVRVAGTPDVVLTVDDVNLDPDNYYSVYATGLVGEEPPLEAELVLDSFK